jgi:hypothetical protein
MNTVVKKKAAPAKKKAAPAKKKAAPAKKKAAAPAKPAAKLAVKAAAKAGAKPATPVKTSKPAAKKAPIQAAAPAKPAVKAAKPVKAPKPAKTKLVRDSFTMPSDEYAVLAQLKQRALAAAHPVKKSELLRAGIKLLAGLTGAALMVALKNVPAIKTGRPKGKKSA